MTGLDCLKEELYNRGFSKQAVEQSKVMPAVLDILSNANGQYMEIGDLQKEIIKLKVEKEKMQHDLARLEQSRSALEWNFENKFNSRYTQIEEYITKFMNAINTCETPEGKDALKTAQIFVNSVNVDTKYDNTAFIIGLAAILTRGDIAPIEELQKINKKIPKPIIQRIKWPSAHYELMET